MDKNLYDQINGDKLCYASVIGDLLDAHLLKGELVRFEPDFVFHLAARSQAGPSYENPADTFAVNVMGTIHVLEAIRSLEKPCTGVMVTTGKVYENKEPGGLFCESDKLGGYDPYGASKAATEIAIAAYRNSFFHPEKYDQHHKAIASVRAGNVIGGGDYATGRFIPDMVRSIEREQAIVLDHPGAAGPWQHVLESLVAYLALAVKMTEQPQQLATAYNVGPEAGDVLDLETVTKSFIRYFGKGAYEIRGNATQPNETEPLLLDNKRIKDTIGLQPRFDAVHAIKMTAEWYADKEHDAAEKCMAQIMEYFAHQQQPRS